MTDNTHTHSNTSSTNGSVVGTPPSSPRTTTFVDASAHDLFHPYSPTHPGFVYDADWIDLYNPDLFDEAPYSANEDPLQGNVTACNNVTAGYAPFDDIPIEKQQCEEEDEQVTEAFVSWYKAQVAAGAFDNATFDNHVEPSHASSSSSSASSVSNGHVSPADLQLVPASLGLTDAERVDLANALKTEIFGYLNLLLSASGNAGPSNPVAELVHPPVAPASTLAHIDNADINTIPGLIAAGDDDDDAESVDTSDDEDADTIEPEDVIRHYWVGHNIRYLFMHNGRKRYMTAEQMCEQFQGVKYALWSYWQKKKASRVPTWRIINHLQHMGHQGFFREMLWHLLSFRLHRILIALRKQGLLDTFQFEDYAE